MEKLTGPNRIGVPTAPRSGQILSLVAASLGPPCVIFLAGFLTIQLQMSQMGAFLLDFNLRPVEVAGEWVPYSVRAGLVLLALAAVLGYRLAIQTEAGRVVTLVVLVAAVFVGAYTFRPLPGDGEPHSLEIFCFIYGATSPFTLALIGAVSIDLASARRRSKAGAAR